LTCAKCARAVSPPSTRLHLFERDVETELQARDQADIAITPGSLHIQYPIAKLAQPAL
jgi:hypothetical protein